MLLLETMSQLLPVEFWRSSKPISRPFVLPSFSVRIDGSDGCRGGPKRENVVVSRGREKKDYGRCVEWGLMSALKAPTLKCLNAAGTLGRK